MKTGLIFKRKLIQEVGVKKMNNRSILITVGTLEEMGKEFISTWHEAEEGKISKSSIIEKIYFKDEILFFFNISKKNSFL